MSQTDLTYNIHDNIIKSCRFSFKLKEFKVAPVLKQPSRKKGVWQSGGQAPSIIHLGAIWTWRHMYVYYNRSSGGEMEAWNGLIWLKTGTGGGLLWMQQWTFGFHKMGIISWLAEKLLASQEGLCSMELVSSVSQQLTRLRWSASSLGRFTSVDKDLFGPLNRRLGGPQSPL